MCSVFKILLLLCTVIVLLPTIHGKLNDLTQRQKNYIKQIGRDFRNLPSLRGRQYAVLTTDYAGEAGAGAKPYNPRPLVEDGQNYVAKTFINDGRGRIDAEKRCIAYYERHLLGDSGQLVFMYTLNSPCRGCAGEIAREADYRPDRQFYIGYSQVYNPGGDPVVGQQILREVEARLKPLKNVHFQALGPQRGGLPRSNADVFMNNDWWIIDRIFVKIKALLSKLYF